MCDCCNKAREWPEHPMFNPACIFCGARIIQRAPAYATGATECSTRRTANLRIWVDDFGHDELEIRRMVKGPLAIGPEKPVAAEPLNPGKPRSRTRK